MQTFASEALVPHSLWAALIPASYAVLRFVPGHQQYQINSVSDPVSQQRNNRLKNDKRNERKEDLQLKAS